jgi:hypothetical protein
MFGKYTVEFLKGENLVKEEFVNDLTWTTLMMKLSIHKRDNDIQFDNVNIWEWKKNKKELVREKMFSW